MKIKIGRKGLATSTDGPASNKTIHEEDQDENHGDVLMMPHLGFLKASRSVPSNQETSESTTSAPRRMRAPTTVTPTEGNTHHRGSHNPGRFFRRTFSSSPRRASRWRSRSQRTEGYEVTETTEPSSSSSAGIVLGIQATPFAPDLILQDDYSDEEEDTKRVFRTRTSSVSSSEEDYSSNGSSDEDEEDGFSSEGEEEVSVNSTDSGSRLGIQHLFYGDDDSSRLLVSSSPDPSKDQKKALLGNNRVEDEEEVEISFEKSPEKEQRSSLFENAWEDDLLKDPDEYLDSPRPTADFLSASFQMDEDDDDDEVECNDGHLEPSTIFLPQELPDFLSCTFPADEPEEVKPETRSSFQLPFWTSKERNIEEEPETSTTWLKTSSQTPTIVEDDKENIEDEITFPAAPLPTSPKESCVEESLDTSRLSISPEKIFWHEEGQHEDKTPDIQHHGSRHEAPNAEVKEQPISDENSDDQIVQSLKEPLSTSVKIFVLLLQPDSKLFELIQLIYPRQITTVGNILNMIPKNATEPALSNQSYTGITRPKKRSPDFMERSVFASEGDLPREHIGLEHGEVVLAIPKGYEHVELVRLAKKILANKRIKELLERANVEDDETKDVSPALQSINELKSSEDRGNKSTRTLDKKESRQKPLDDATNRPKESRSDSNERESTASSITYAASLPSLGLSDNPYAVSTLRHSAPKHISESISESTSQPVKSNDGSDGNSVHSEKSSVVSDRTPPSSFASLTYRKRSSSVTKTSMQPIVRTRHLKNRSLASLLRVAGAILVVMIVRYFTDPMGRDMAESRQHVVSQSLGFFGGLHVVLCAYLLVKFQRMVTRERRLIIQKQSMWR